MKINCKQRTQRKDQGTPELEVCVCRHISAISLLNEQFQFSLSLPVSLKTVITGLLDLLVPSWPLDSCAAVNKDRGGGGKGEMPAAPCHPHFFLVHLRIQ